MTPSKSDVMTYASAGGMTWLASDFWRARRAPFASYTAVTADKL